METCPLDCDVEWRNRIDGHPSENSDALPSYRRSINIFVLFLR